MGFRHVRAPVVLAALLVALAAGCQGTKGNVSSGRYESPLKDFSLPIPVEDMGLRIEDGLRPAAAGQLRGQWVSFHNDFGSLVAIETEEMPEKLRQALNDPAQMSEHLKRFLNDAYVPLKREAIPDLKTSHDEIVTLQGGVPALFVVIDFPGGSPMIVTDAEHPQGKRMDSTRPHLFFVHGSVQYILSVAHDIGFGVGEPARSESADAAQIARWKDELVKIYGSISFH